jgi:cytochrome oxidase Cu insertion factor (SCO1/SenC/PrrC family)
LLIEDDHYQKLKNIIKQFESFQFGKQRLVDLRNRTAQSKNVVENEIRYTIDDNGQIKEEFTALLNELRSHFKEQISGANIT